MNSALKGILIMIGLLALFIIGFWIFQLVYLFGAPNYSKEDLIENYNLRSSEIIELRNYIKSIVPAHKVVEIEFEGNGTMSIFNITDDGAYYSDSDFTLRSSKVTTMLKKLGWTRETLSALKEKLDDANCISIESGEPCTIGFQRSGLGKYYYKLFNQTLTASLKEEFNDGCTYQYYTNNVVLEYGGGAVGPQCFEDFKRGE